ncbi:MAG: glycosyltransferase family 4 protein, partial [Acidimicrobiia bacterium]
RNRSRQRRGDVTRSITVATSVHPPDDPRIRVKSIATLLEVGWDVTYVCQAPGPIDTTGFEVVVLDGPRLRRTLEASRAMFSLDADVTVVHDPELLPAAIALGRMRGRDRIVFDLHEDLPRQLMTRAASSPLMRRPSAVASMWMLKVAERAVTVTLAEPNYSWMFADEHEVFENLPISAELPLRREDAVGVVYVGDITQDRGVPLLVDAMGQTPGVPLTLIGRCSPSLATELEQAAADGGVPLTMTGFLPYAEAWALAAEHCVGVSPLLDLPNYRASLPTKIDEYRAVGLIAITSDLPGSVPAIAGSDAASSFAAGDPNALATELRSALHDPVRLAAAMTEAPEVRRSRAWDGERFANFYESLVTASP